MKPCALQLEVQLQLERTCKRTRKRQTETGVLSSSTLCRLAPEASAQMSQIPLRQLWCFVVDTEEIVSR